jgi:molybdate transport system substrate-binding protein
MLRFIVCALALLAAGCGRNPKPEGDTDDRVLTLLCGAGIQPALEPIRKAFEEQHHCTVRVIYAGSGALLGQLQAGAPADLYLPGDTAWVQTARDKGLVSTQTVVAWFTPVIAVQKGNPKQIKGLNDLTRPDVAVGLGRSEACAVGSVSRAILRGAGLADKLKPQFEALTVNALTQHVQIKAIDAAIVWDATAAQFGSGVDVVELEDPDFHAVPMAIGLVKATEHRKLAEAFMAFAADDTGAQAFRDNHYTVAGNRLRIGCGGSMRAVMEDLAALFEEQTGCTTLRDYGGSGPVLLQIEESKEGDVYVCHDPFAYLCEDKGLASAWHTMAVMTATLAVQQGNPKQVQGFKDLLREDLKIGLSHREYSTRGRIVWALLKKYGMAKAMENRAIFEERTHTLVNQLKLGAVDVATLWDAPAKAMAEIDVIPIEEKYHVDAVTSATSKRTYDPQNVKVTVVRLNLSTEPLLAAQFAKTCLSEAGRAILQTHCFTLPDTQSP